MRICNSNDYFIPSPLSDCGKGLIVELLRKRYGELEGRGEFVRIGDKRGGYVKVCRNFRQGAVMLNEKTMVRVIGASEERFLTLDF